ncbi:MAG: hypothetical protein AAGH49_07315 [Pseudomonadota bacterium]
MFELANFNQTILPDVFFEQARWVDRLFPRRPKVKILVVVDTSVGLSGGFGIGKAVSLIRANVDSYVRFDVDQADLGRKRSLLQVNAAPGPTQPKYENFRFSSRVNGRFVINDYDQIWCFGFAPTLHSGGSDTQVTGSPYAATDNDMAVLTDWMNKGGGVFATGDHYVLGAAMAYQIPRVRNMRRWTIAEGVPPISGPARFDTHQPADSDQDPKVKDPPDEIPGSAQTDNVPQPVEWKRYPLFSASIFQRRFRPHPVLCGGELGVIDVFPDHAHEGWLYEDDDVNLNATYEFGDVSGDEFPEIDGVRPRPEIIGWANTLADPPHNHDKGPTPARRFGLVGIYDGDPIDYGRVVVDSTWHHWMDLNLNGLEAESPNTEFQKIARYFRNVAVWLSRKRQRSQMLNYSTFWASILAENVQDVNTARPVNWLGGSGIDVIGRVASDCLVRDWINIFIPPRLRYPILNRPVLPDPCLSCPPIDFLQEAIANGVLREMAVVREKTFNTRFEKTLQKAFSKLDPKLEKAKQRGLKAGMKEYTRAVSESEKALRQFNADVRGSLAPKKRAG